MRERGESAISILVGIALGLLLVVGIGVAGTTAMRAVASAGAVQAATLSTTQLLGGLERDAHGALAVFVPVNDAFGHDNADRHELDFYSRDAAGNGSFVAYCYNASGASCAGASTAGTLSRYHGSWSQHGNGTMALDGATYTGLTSFSATTYHVDELTDAGKDAVSAQLLASAGVTPVRQEFDVGYTGARYSDGNGAVRAGNPVTVVHVVSPGGDRTIHLAAGILPTAVQIALSTYTPPPNVPAAGGSGTNLVFASPLYPPSLDAVITERNYGTNPSATRAQVYTYVGGSGTDCAAQNDADAAPVPIATPVPDGSGTATVAVRPRRHVLPSGAACTLQYADNVPNSVVFNVSIGATQAPSLVYSSGPRTAAGVSYFFATEAIGLHATEGNYPDASHGGGFGGWSACGTVTPGAAAASLGNHTTAAQDAVFAAGPTASCSASVGDVYGQTANAPAVALVGDVALTSVPSMTFAGTGDPAQTLSASESGANWALTVGGCNGIVSIAATSASAPNGSWSVSPVSSGTCTITIADPVGSQGYTDGSGASRTHTGAVTVNVAVDASVHDQCDNAYGTYVSTTPGSPPTLHYGTGTPCSSSVTWSVPSVSVVAGATSGSFSATATASGGFGDTVRTSAFSGPCAAATLTKSGDTTATETFSVTGVSAGTCTLGATDQYGAAAPPLVVTVSTPIPVTYTLAVSPTAVSTTAPNTSPAFTATGSASDGSADPVSASITTNTGNVCSALTSSGASPSVQSFTVIGSTAGSCTITVTDAHGNTNSVTATFSASPTSVYFYSGSGPSSGRSSGQVTNCTLTLVRESVFAVSYGALAQGARLPWAYRDVFTESGGGSGGCNPTDSFSSGGSAPPALDSMIQADLVAYCTITTCIDTSYADVNNWNGATTNLTAMASYYSSTVSPSNILYVRGGSAISQVTYWTVGP